MNTSDRTPPGQSENQLSEAMKRDLAKMDRLAYLLDNSLGLPGTKFRIGLDPLIGLIPILGDVVTLLISLYLLFYAGRYKMGGGVIFLMAMNILLDYAIGSIPVLGDLLDFGYKANARNARLMRKELSKRLPEQGSLDNSSTLSREIHEKNNSQQSSDNPAQQSWLVTGVVALLFVAGLTGIFYLLFQFFSWIGTNIF